jgi:hypothetical protein
MAFTITDNVFEKMLKCIFLMIECLFNACEMCVCVCDIVIVYK